MYLLLFCMHVQNTAGDKEMSKKKSNTCMISNNSDFTIRFQVEHYYPTQKRKPKTEDHIYKILNRKFRKLSKLLVNDETRNVKCRKNKANKCKKCYSVCCDVQRPSVRINPMTPPYSYGIQS